MKPWVKRTIKFSNPERVEYVNNQQPRQGRSEKTIRKRFSSNIEVLNDLYDTGKNVQILTGHFF